MRITDQRLRLLYRHARSIGSQTWDRARTKCISCSMREAPIFSPKERAALAWTEALTRLAGGDVSDEVYAGTRQHFSEKEVADLSFAIAEINAWNRLMICSRTPPPLGSASA